jgi:hypothetical protein
MMVNANIFHETRQGMCLRIKDVDFDRQVVIVREAKGGKDRVVMLPRALVQALRSQMLASGGTASPLDTPGNMVACLKTLQDC